MRLRIRHKTSFRYSAPIDYAIQLIRLTPTQHNTQGISDWSVRQEGAEALPESVDGYGNLVHMLSVDRDQAAAAVIAEGVIETSDARGRVQGIVEHLPPDFFSQATRATKVTPELAELAQAVQDTADPVDRLHRLMGIVRRAVQFTPSAATIHATAADALRAGVGVGRDFAHVFVTCARALGHPARYVSGYLLKSRAKEPEEIRHAWAEAQIDGIGWIGFDAANDTVPTEGYIRVAAGLDHKHAAPITAYWRGPGHEIFAEAIQIQPLEGSGSLDLPSQVAAANRSDRVRGDAMSA